MKAGRLHLDEQCQTSSCKSSNGSSAEDKCKEKEEVGGGEGGKVVEAKAQADRRQGCCCTLKQGVDYIADQYFRVGKGLTKRGFCRGSTSISQSRLPPGRQ